MTDFSTKLSKTCINGLTIFLNYTEWVKCSCFSYVFCLQQQQLRCQIFSNVLQLIVVSYPESTVVPGVLALKYLVTGIEDFILLEHVSVGFWNDGLQFSYGDIRLVHMFLVLVMF